MHYLNYLISKMNVAHWMMIGGCVLVTVGFVGFAFQKNAKIEEAEISPPPIEPDSHN